MIFEQLQSTSHAHHFFIFYYFLCTFELNDWDTSTTVDFILKILLNADWLLCIELLLHRFSQLLEGYVFLWIEYTLGQNSTLNFASVLKYRLWCSFFNSTSGNDFWPFIHQVCIGMLFHTHFLTICITVHNIENLTQSWSAEHYQRHLTLDTKFMLKFTEWVEVDIHALSFCRWLNWEINWLYPTTNWLSVIVWMAN